MRRIDLSRDIPDECNAIEIHVATRPPCRRVTVYRHEADREPLRMVHGGTTIIGRPRDKCLFVETHDEAVECSLSVFRWLA
ncbi:MAG: hypothetical protein AB7Q81_02555 [Gammaproteobacteria bacterium]